MKSCCNPFGISHSKSQDRSAKKISDIDRCRALFPRFPWNEDSMLCPRCRLKMLGQYKNLAINKAGVETARKKSKLDSTSSGAVPGTSGADNNNTPVASSGTIAEPVVAAEGTAGTRSEATLGDASSREAEASITPLPSSVEMVFPSTSKASSSSASSSSSLPEVQFTSGAVPSTSTSAVPTSSTVATQNLYPTLDFEPSAPVAAGIYPELFEEPSTSEQATVRQPPYNPNTTSPPESVVASSVTGTEVSQKSSTSSDTARREISEKLNKSLKSIDIIPTRPSDIKKPGTLRKRLQKFKKSASETFESLTGIQASPETSKTKKCLYCTTLLQELSGKFKEQKSRIEKYKTLTCIPKRFTTPEVIESTGCSQYVARVASTLKNDHGAFTWPSPIRGRPMDPDHVQIIQDFYTHDDSSRAVPNQTIDIKKPDGQTERVAKRLILHNLNDLYLDFKHKNSNIPVSVSKFSKLRPKNCVWPGFRGHHVTCVCETHQNFEFILEALESNLTVTEFVKRAVCETEGELNEDCHLGLCGQCPKTDFLNELITEIDDDDEVTCNQWLRTDSTEMRTTTMSKDAFSRMFTEYVPKIIEHEYITQKQKAAIRNLREKVIRDKAAITLQVDYAQNYSFIIQNAVQGYHWNNKQATVHPFVAHFWNPEKECIDYKTYCIISDEMSHDADTFHVFRSAVIPEIVKDMKTPVNKIYYISDGAAGQYKNFKNFSNLMLHQNDYGLEAEWHFTSTSHGKGMCNAMSAVVKCSCRRESLKPHRNVRDVSEMFNFCQRDLSSPKLNFIKISKEEVALQRPVLEERYKQFKTILGTRKHHMFRPRDNGMMIMGRTSDSDVVVEIDFRTVEVTSFSSDNIKLGCFYAFYEGTTYQVGLLVEIDAEEGDVKFQVLNLNRNTRVAKWQEPLLFTDISYRDILMELKEPETEDGTTYKIKKDEMVTIRSKVSLYKAART